MSLREVLEHEVQDTEVSSVWALYPEGDVSRVRYSHRFFQTSEVLPTGQVWQIQKDASQRGTLKGALI